MRRPLDIANIYHERGWARTAFRAPIPFTDGTVPWAKRLHVLSQLIFWTDKVPYDSFIIAGGAARRLQEPHITVSQYEPGDIDIFFSDLMALRPLYQYMKKYPFKEVYRTQNAITMASDHNEDCGAITVQLIWRRAYKSVDALFRDFDFTICQFALDHEWLYTTPEALTDLTARRLRMNNVDSWPNSLARMFKFEKQGFDMPKHEQEYMILQASEHGMKWPEDFKNVSPDSYQLNKIRGVLRK